MRLGIVVGKSIIVLSLFIKNLLFFFDSLLLAMISPTAISTLFSLVYGHLLGLYDAIGSSLELDKLTYNFTLLTFIMQTWLVHLYYQFL